MAYQAYKESPDSFRFEPDVLIPSEYENTFRRKDHRAPEVRLMAAVLDDAVMCFQKYLPPKTAKARRMLAEAEEWFFGEEQDEIFSFENICDNLDLDSNYLRRGLLDLKRQILSRHVKRSNHDRRSVSPIRFGRSL